ncbi:ABC transporter permease [Spiroplasma endosymbiont of Aspidapion aeneum]|uniref:ABC transporter permease n=1 Tax=Spiroplasma endosymbiont of Aspidapion aeneum TaxID=3066276 RepID=UPI00313C20FC
MYKNTSDTNIKDEKKTKIRLKKDKFYSILSKSQLYILPFFIVAIFLIIVPLFFVFISSFTQKDKSSSNAYFIITFEKYIQLFQSKSVWRVLGISLMYGFFSSILCIIIGYPIAYILAGINKKIYTKNLWIIITLPTWICVILKTIGLQSMFNLLMPSALGTSFAIIFGMVYLFLPFTIIPITNSLINQNPIYYKAALDLKASKVRAFIDIKLRYSTSGILTAFNIVFIQAITTLLIVKYLGANSITMISSLIETYFLKGGDLGYSAVLSVALVVIVLLVLFISRVIANTFSRERTK